MSHVVVTTTSGARAIRCTTTDEVMHPGVGPLVEAEQLYVGQARLAERLAAGPLTLFDVGLGAGTNALTARAIAERGGHALRIISFEHDLGALTLALDHPADFALDGEAGVAARTLLEHHHHAGAHTTWHLRHGDLLAALDEEPRRADVIFWDPFSPKANPSLWTVAAFAAARRLASPGCTLFTYSASTATRVALLLAGWAVGVGDAIGTKAQTTAAATDAALLARPLPTSWLTRLERPDAPRPADAPADAVARLRAHAQFAAG